jgi:hypothetical protein
MANNYAHPPPMQQLPGINLAPYTQNGQQPPFPAFPPPDANLWALFQSGSFPPGAPNLPPPPPPPFPNMAFPPPSLPPQPERVQDVMDSDREDGELSEGDSPPTLMDKLQQDRDAAKQFIKLLHSNNVSYRALANEQLDPELLRSLYQSANLPSEPAPILPPKTNDAVSRPPAVQPAAPVAQDAPKSVASPTTPGHRQDYIARLQAAKAAKQAGAKTTTPAPATKTPQPATPPTAKPPVTDEQRARNTELIKQRLEAIKARQKPPPVTPGSNTPTSAAYTPSFSAIPGLFMSAASAPNTPAPTISQPSSLPNPVAPHTRPLGQSPHADQEDDSMIIDVSEDESNGSDMDIDEDQPAPQASQSSRQAPGNLPNFHSGAPPATPSAAAVGTPGAQTPTTVAREKELVDKEKQLVAMRETLKKKLAEKRERDRLAAAATAATSPSAGQKPSTPVSSLQTSTSATLPTSTTQLVSFPSHSKDTNRMRRAEIQSKLPTLDAEIASNANRMAQLTKELEQLTAQNERIARDKERLTKELEDLGVDTEGMSHAQLRAKKDEIEGEQTPDSNPSSDQVDPVSQSRVNKPSPAPVPASSQQPSLHTALPGLGQSTIQPEQDSHATPQLPEQATPTQATLNQANASQVLSQQDNSYSGTSQILSEPQNLPVNGTMALNPSAPPFVYAAQQNSDDVFQSHQQGTEMHVESATEAAKANANVAEEQEPQQPISASSPSEEGEVDMSVSEGDEDEEDEEEYEPEYEPEESVVIAEAPVEEEVEVQTKPEYSLESSQASPQEEETYEPPDVDEEIPDVQANGGAVLTQDEPTVQAEAEDGAMDIATSSDESSDDSESDDESTPEPEMGKSISAYNPLHQDAGIADDLAPELQPEVTPPAAAGGPVRQSPHGRPS